MNDTTPGIDSGASRRGGPGGYGRGWAWLLLVLVLAVVWIGVWQRERIAGWFGDGADGTAAGSQAGDPAGTAAADADRAGTADAVAEAERERRAEAWEATLDRAPAWPADVADPADCAGIRADWQAAVASLDAELSAEGAGDPDVALFELLRNPPRASGELRDHAILLANVTHLFRTLGRRRVEALRGALGDVDDALEPLALAAYRRVAAGPACRDAEGFAPAAGPAPPPEAAGEYAAWLLGTLGGQAYLRRRAPRVEALASFYAIEILDRADRDGRNPHGLDLLPEVGRTRALIAAEPFLFRDRYLQELDRIEDRWSRRADDGAR